MVAGDGMPAEQTGRDKPVPYDRLLLRIRARTPNRGATLVVARDDVPAPDKRDGTSPSPTSACTLARPRPGTRS